MSDRAGHPDIPLTRVEWTTSAGKPAVRIISSVHPPIDLFEDIADPADWPLLISAEQKTNPRLMETIGNLDLVPPGRRVGGQGASYLMAPFTHVSRDRPSRFSDGSYGVLYAGDSFEVALLETAHHHGRFMACTAEPPGWASQFREIVLDVAGELHDLRQLTTQVRQAEKDVLAAESYRASQPLGARLRASGSDGLVWPSVRCAGGECVGLFYPDLAGNAAQGRHLDYHWNGERVDLCRELDSGRVYRIAEG